MAAAASSSNNLSLPSVEQKGGLPLPRVAFEPHGFPHRCRLPAENGDFLSLGMAEWGEMG